MKRIITTLVSLMAAFSAFAVRSPYNIYPVPQKQVPAEGTAGFTAEVEIIPESGIDRATINRAVEIMERLGLTAVESAKPSGKRSCIMLGVNGSRERTDRLASKLKLDRTLFNYQKFDRHILSLTSDKHGNATVVILAENTDAAFCGLASLEQMLDNGFTAMQCVTIYDWADIQNRGVIEGYYGVPYSAEVTKDLFRFMARYKLNTYMYGAKSDPYHSRFWSEPYPESITDEQMRIGYLSQDMLKQITEVAHACKVNFVWAIHPGRAFTNPEDKTVNERIMNKFENMYNLGVRQFGVFVDDVGVPYDAPTQKLGADRLTDLQNRIDAKWNVAGASPADTVKPLHYVPQLYAYAWASPENARIFFESLSVTPSKINIYITGRAVWSVPNNEDLSTVKDYLGREASWWWNYPCNDNDVTKLFPMDMYTNFRDETHIDNLARLEDGLTTNTLIINPMQQGEVSKIALFSLGDYAWNNAAFDCQRSWEASIPAVAGKKYAAALRYLAPYLRYYDSDALSYAVNQYKKSFERGNPEPESLIARMEKILESCKELDAMASSSNQSDRLLHDDMKPWLAKLETLAQTTIDLLEGKDVSSVDLENDSKFQFEVLRGMGAGIVMQVRSAEPCAEILCPFIEWLKQQQKKTFSPSNKESNK